ncbi:MAG: right-handed parallel beta-helix repeat-containing protein [Phycisphaerae bacterium]|nr:right-handed parallel beta-helix repeat-containing protein [Phycisphaerae bacterium]
MVVVFRSETSAVGRVFYLSKHGNDNNSGLSISRPLRTLATAARQMGPGDICRILAGVYHQTLRVDRSGLAGEPITFEPYRHAHVVIDAAGPISGWQWYQGHIYSAPVPHTPHIRLPQVFLNGRMILPARYPRQVVSTPFQPGAALITVPAKSRHGYFSTSRRMSAPQFAGHRHNYFRGARFVGRVGVAWSVQTALVKASSRTGILRLANRTHWWFAGRGHGYLLGLRRFLGQPTQWVYRTGRLYLGMAPGQTPAQYRIAIQKHAWCVDIRRRSWVVIHGLAFHGGAIRILGDHCVLSHCRCRYLGQYLPPAGHRKAVSKRVGVRPCGIVVTGNYNVVEHCRIAWSAGDGIVLQGNYNLVIRNVIRNIDYSGTYASPLQILTGRDNRILFNTVFNAGRDLLQFRQPHHDVVEFNNFYHAGLLCRDLGIIYAWGTNGDETRIAFNWIHGNYNSGPNPGIYLDNGCRNFIVDHNVIWNCPGDAGVRINGPCANELIVNNTLFNCLPVGARIYVSLRPAGQKHWPIGVHYQSINNLYLGKSPRRQLVAPARDNFRLRLGAPAFHAGRRVAGITPLVHGRRPDLGAYQQGQVYWTPGVTGVR